MRSKLGHRDAVRQPLAASPVLRHEIKRKVPRPRHRKNYDCPDLDKPNNANHRTWTPIKKPPNYDYPNSACPKSYNPTTNGNHRITTSKNSDYPKTRQSQKPPETTTTYGSFFQLGRP